MFFVGATGQLLTLVLTVILPFVFLFSGHQKIEIKPDSSLLIIQQDSEFLTQFEQNTTGYNFVFTTSLTTETHFFENTVFLKYPDKILFADTNLFYLNSSGNKAPPSVQVILC